VGWKGGLILAALAPAEGLFRLAVATRNSLYDKGMARIISSAIEVVSVGNLTVGGTGKTPFAAWLVNELCARGHQPALVHGGYGEDEAELHKRWHPQIPVLVGRDRVTMAREAERLGATVVVLDDGFQHRRLSRALDIVLVSAEAGLDRVRLLPRGPFREPLASLRRAGVVVVTRKTASAGAASAVADRLVEYAGGPVAVAALKPVEWRNGGVRRDPPGGTVIAVAGIAQPDRFADNALEAGARVAGTLWFDDHHDYTVDDARTILEVAGGGPVVTTEKDMVKLETLIPPERLWVLIQRVVIERGAAELSRALDAISR